MKVKICISFALILAMLTSLFSPIWPGKIRVVNATVSDVLNGGFEETGTGGNSSYWTDPNFIATGWTLSGNNSTGHYAKATVVQDVYHSGNNALKIESLTTADRLFMTQIINIPEADRGKRFSYSAFVKTQNITTGKNVGIRIAQFTGANATGTQIGLNSDVTKSNNFDWTKLTNTVTTDVYAASVKLSYIFGFGSATLGTSWIDDASFQEVIDSITFENTTAAVTVGDTVQLTPVFIPAAATNTVTWNSSDTTVATVDGNGAITGIKPGTATITATSTVDPTKVASASVTVNSASFVYLNGISVTPDAATLEVGNSVYLNPSFDPANATDTTHVWSSSDVNVATVNDSGAVTGVKPGTTNITVASVADPTKTAVSAITVNGLALDQTTATVTQGRNLLLTPSVMPQTNLIWTSTDTGVATVQDGLVKSAGPGNAAIRAMTSDGKYTAECSLTVSPYTLDEFDNLRQKYSLSLLGGLTYDLSDPAVEAIVSGIADSAQTYWSTMDPTGTYLWTDVPCIVPGGPKRPAADITTNYTRLLTMAKAYLMDGSSLKGNIELLRDIIRGLEWMYTHGYNESLTVGNYVGANGTGNGNWWDFVIGSPRNINSIISLLYDTLTSEQVTRFEAVVRHFLPSPTSYTDSYYNPVTSVGGNLSDTSKNTAIMGINLKDGNMIASARDALSGNFQIVTKGEGIYPDGSFIQHVFVPYNNTYGQVLLQGLSDVLNVLSGSSWEIKDPAINNIYNWLITGFEPLMYKGSAMDMTSGRAISRGGYQDHDNGASIITTFIQYSQFAPKEYADRYKSVAKYWMQQDTYRDYISNIKDIILKSQAVQLLNDDTVVPAKELTGQFNYPNMDRVVHRTPNFSLGISMYSSRTSNYETMNGENLHGWHTNDGMTYLYNGNLGNFANDFWATVNPYRLPGTTVDTLPMADAFMPKITSPQSWVGGTTLDGLYGIAGMFLDKKYMDSYNVISDPLSMDLQAKKSWFMFDKEIVAIGAGINSTESDTRAVKSNIETIVDNRPINNAGDNVLTVDGVQKPSDLGYQEVINDAHWMHIAGDVPNSDVGYYFPEGATVNSLREARTGKWSDINIKGSTDPITRNYLTTWFDHGSNPVDTTYSYVLLPNMSKDDVKAYSDKPDITVLANTPKLQAVRKNSLNIIGMNSWTDEPQTADYITTDKQSSIMAKETDGYIEISVSDPTMLNTGSINVELNKVAAAELLNNPDITVTQLSPTIKFTVNVNGAQGKSFVAKFAKPVSEDNDQNNNGNNNGSINDNNNNSNTNNNNNNNNNSNNNNQNTNDNKGNTHVDKTFDDLGNYEWAQKAIEVLAAKGIINGTSDNTFTPEKSITRADFIVMLINTLGLKSDIDSNFSDVDKSEYYYIAVGIAKKLGITNGAGENLFNPNEEITRQDMMVLAAKALKLAGKLQSAATADATAKFKDKEAIKGYALDSVSTLVNEGLILGDNGNINPTGNLTRAESAVFMYRLLNK